MSSDDSYREIERYDLFMIALEVARCLDQDLGGNTVEAKAREMRVLLEFQNETWNVYTQRLFAFVCSRFTPKESDVLISEHVQGVDGLDRTIRRMTHLLSSSVMTEKGRPLLVRGKEEYVLRMFESCFDALARPKIEAMRSFAWARTFSSPPRCS